MSAPRVCILGYGKVARELHRPAWQALEAAGRAKVSLVSESTRDGARSARVHFPEAKVVQGDAASVLESADCDVVDICTPGHTHAALTLQALGRGLATVVEKPLCHTIADVDAITAASRDTPITVGQTLRFSPPARSLAKARDEGRLGEIRRVGIRHHARHALSEVEWITKARPDGMLFENAIHAVDLAYFIIGSFQPLQLEASKFYEMNHRRILLGLEVFASDPDERHVTLDFLQDSLTHSSFESSAFVSGTGADAELQFSPSGFRLISGVPDPMGDLRADSRRLLDVALTICRPARRSSRHYLLFADLLDAMATGRPTLIPPSSVRSTVQTLEELSTQWLNAAPARSERATSAVIGEAGGRSVAERIASA